MVVPKRIRRSDQKDAISKSVSADAVENTMSDAELTKSTPKSRRGSSRSRSVPLRSKSAPSASAALKAASLEAREMEAVRDDARRWIQDGAVTSREMASSGMSRERGFRGFSERCYFGFVSIYLIGALIWEGVYSLLRLLLFVVTGSTSRTKLREVMVRERSVLRHVPTEIASVSQVSATGAPQKERSTAMQDSTVRPEISRPAISNTARPEEVTKSEAVSAVRSASGRMAIVLALALLFLSSGCQYITARWVVREFEKGFEETAWSLTTMTGTPTTFKRDLKGLWSDIPNLVDFDWDGVEESLFLIGLR